MSAKNNRESNVEVTRSEMARNKKYIIRKKPGRKATKQQLEVSSSVHNSSLKTTPMTSIESIIESQLSNEQNERYKRDVELLRKLLEEKNREIAEKDREIATMVRELNKRSARGVNGNQPLGYRNRTGKRNSEMYESLIYSFKGGEGEDYDVWWEDLQACFVLRSYSENDKICLFKAHIGGEARKFLQNEDMESWTH